MIYEWTISTSTTYSSSNKLATLLRIEFGLIVELFVDFPPGPSGLLYLHINHGLSQVFPKSKGYFHGNNRLFEFRHVEYPVFVPPFELTAFTWNDSTRFSHDVSIYINLIRMGSFV